MPIMILQDSNRTADTHVTENARTKMEHANALATKRLEDDNQSRIMQGQQL